MKPGIARRDAGSPPEGNDPAVAVATAQMPIIVQSRALVDTDMAAILESGFVAADTQPAELYAFEIVAASDGLDFYFTRQRAATSLVNFAEDLTRGQALLTGHDIGLISYGQSYAGEVAAADPAASYYEDTFYRKWSGDPALATSQVAIGRYYMARGLTLNGQATDDLIRTIELGINRKASVSFTVGGYVCGLDNKPMIDYGWGPLPDQDLGCAHFPGIEYPEGVAWAWMDDNTLLETSLVYKNASPSALLIRRAAGMAQAGLLAARDIPALEARLQVRLPSRVRRVHPAATPGQAKEAASMTHKKRVTTARHAEDTVDETVDPTAEDETLEATDIAEGDTAATGTDATGDDAGDAEDAEDTEAQDEADEDAETEADGEPTRIARHAGHKHSGDDKGGHLRTDAGEADATAEDAEAGDPEAVLEAASEAQADAEDQRMVGRMRQITARDRAIRELIGGPLTVSAIRSLVSRAKLGDQLFDSAIEEAVRLRTSVQREEFDAAGYRAALRAVGTLEYVLAEQRSWSKDKAAIYTHGRQLEADDIRDDDDSDLKPADVVDIGASTGRSSNDGSLLAQPRRRPGVASTQGTGS